MPIYLLFHPGHVNSYATELWYLIEVLSFFDTLFDTTLTQLVTVKNDLRTIYNRNEITKTDYDNLRPVSTTPARAHGLPKIHKTFDDLSQFRLIIDTTRKAYQIVYKILSKLLNPLTTNEFSVKIVLMLYRISITFLAISR